MPNRGVLQQLSNDSTVRVPRYCLEILEEGGSLSSIPLRDGVFRAPYGRAKALRTSCQTKIPSG